MNYFYFKQINIILQIIIITLIVIKIKHNIIYTAINTQIKNFLNNISIYQ